MEINEIEHVLDNLNNNIEVLRNVIEYYHKESINDVLNKLNDKGSPDETKKTTRAKIVEE